MQTDLECAKSTPQTYREPVKDQIIFPRHSIVGRTVPSLQEFRRLLNSQESDPSRHKWFKLSYDQGDRSFYQCTQGKNCMAMVVLHFDSIQGFTIEEVKNIHNHAVNKDIQEIRNHHICSEVLSTYEGSSVFKPDIGPYTLKIKSSCKGNPGPASLTYRLESQNGHIVLSGKQQLQVMTNNQAEFKGLIWGMLDCLEHQLSEITVKSNSKLIIDCMNRKNSIKSPKLQALISTARVVETKFKGKIYFEHMCKSELSCELANECREVIGLKNKKDTGESFIKAMNCW